MSSPLLEDYTLNIMQSFGGACAVTALLLVLESYEPDEQTRIKEKMLSVWRKNWLGTFQRDLLRYNGVLGRVENGSKLTQTEDIQTELNRALAAAEKSARIALRMEEAS